MSFLEAIILGSLQGFTEFLPISSTGHLILARTLFSIDTSYALAFDALLHLATVLAVVVYFKNDIWVLTQVALRKLSRLPVNRKDEVMLYALLVATVPAVVFGLFLESYMESTFRSPLLVAAVLVIGSVLFMYAEWTQLNKPRTHDMSVAKGLKIGFFQVLALLPGMSRSGATISGGMILGLTRVEAARFAFLMAIPVITGAGCKKLLELITSDEVVAWTAVGIGATASFLTGLLAIHFMLNFVKKHTLWPFIWYRLILAFFVVFIVLLG